MNSLTENKLLINTKSSPIIESFSNEGLTPGIYCYNKSTPTSPTSSRKSFRINATRRMRKRAVFKNGDCNILQSQISKRRLRFLQDYFTTLVDSQWRWTLTVFAVAFIASWLIFALIWWLIAFTHGDLEIDHLPTQQAESNWTPCVLNIHSFASCFLFSIETQHTIGYGVRTTTEECPEAIFVMCLQSIIGMIIQAYMTGIVFAKMTRPKLRSQTLLFSRNAVICQREGFLCLMFRIGDMRKSHIIGASIRAHLIRTRKTKEGETLNNYQTNLNVSADGADSDVFLIWPMTIVHKIDEDSPLYHLSASDMLQDRFEIVIILEGTIESTAQSIQARSSYLASEILWGHRFEPVVSYNKERQGYEVNYSRFDNTIAVDTPLCSGAELAEFNRLQEEDGEHRYDIPLFESAPPPSHPPPPPPSERPVPRPRPSLTLAMPQQRPSLTVTSPPSRPSATQILSPTRSATTAGPPQSPTSPARPDTSSRPSLITSGGPSTSQILSPTRSSSVDETPILPTRPSGTVVITTGPNHSVRYGFEEDEEGTELISYV